MATKNSTSKQPAGNIVRYKDADGREHHASRTAPHVVKGLESGDYTLLEEVAPDGPTTTAAGKGNAADPKPAANGS